MLADRNHFSWIERTGDLILQDHDDPGIICFIPVESDLTFFRAGLSGWTF